ncbi:hypothetical protein [Cobetia sp. Dlab-2-U]|nr:hypothetical protein [Cobetia sp. Dlab-2-U]
MGIATLLLLDVIDLEGILALSNDGVALTGLVVGLESSNHSAR